MLKIPDVGFGYNNKSSEFVKELVAKLAQVTPEATVDPDNQLESEPFSEKFCNTPFDPPETSFTKVVTVALSTPSYP